MEAKLHDLGLNNRFLYMTQLKNFIYLIEKNGLHIKTSVSKDSIQKLKRQINE